MMGDILALLFNTAVFAAALRMATPLIFAALGEFSLNAAVW